MHNTTTAAQTIVDSQIKKKQTNEEKKNSRNNNLSDWYVFILNKNDSHISDDNVTGDAQKFSVAHSDKIIQEPKRFLFFIKEKNWR